MHGNLDIAIDATHEVLRHRLDKAVTNHDGSRRCRGDVPHDDRFLASTSRHLAAVNAVLLPQERHCADGKGRCKEFLQQCRRLELVLGEVKGKLYGNANAMQRSWADVWAEVRAELDRTLELERGLVDDLIGSLDDAQLDALASKLYHAELHAPSRPHPYLPHAGVGGLMARRVAHTVDRFWDATECRMVPPPVMAHDHAHDGLLTHYLLADADPDVADRTTGARP